MQIIFFKIKHKIFDIMIFLIGGLDNEKIESGF